MVPRCSFRSVAITLAVGCLWVATAADAATITPLEQERRLSADVGATELSRSAMDFLPWTDVIELENFDRSVTAISRHDSTIGQQRVEASGSISVIDIGSGGSLFDLTFSIDAAVGYTLEGFTGGGEFITAGFVWLRDANGGSIYASSPFSNFSTDGVLQAGTYQLRAGAGLGATGDGSGRFSSFNFTFVIPEPGTAGLLAVGLVALPGRRRARSRRRQTRRSG